MQRGGADQRGSQLTCKIGCERPVGERFEDQAPCDQATAATDLARRIEGRMGDRGPAN